MTILTKDNFSIKQICESGQCFRLERLDGQRYSLVAFGKYLEIMQEGNQLSFDCEPEEFESLWRDYFDWEEDYGKIISAIDKEDAYLLGAASYGSGIRILRQDLWEMIVSFIVSQQNNIRRIRKCISLLCQRYGEEKTAASGKRYYDFPDAKALAGASLEDLYACNLGYRSRYIRETAVSIAQGAVDLEAVRQMDYEAAKAELMKLCGVGIKVAECICLFALHKTEAFPVDTHINKVLAMQYPKGFPFDRYKGSEGTLQQYIFYFDLMNG
ncbi:MAG: 8-oxoguanine DNA glycosylase [Lachnospiraceae bacterium]|nr:8-oxoguanine DNA glycosylase [Lachnospiraceae bacterium]